MNGGRTMKRLFLYIAYSLLVIFANISKAWLALLKRGFEWVRRESDGIGF